jgi:Na+-translocating ferredoxin:NAD+ oxidoreductase RNF subunit RnfB
VNNVEEKDNNYHYVRIDEKLCNGCVLCMKACPTQAIRVLDDGVAHIQGTCIECGNCIRACPRGAITSVTAGKDALKMSKYHIVPVTSALYAQFGEDVMPNDILLAMRKAFDFVYDQSYTQELFNVATGLYINEQRSKDDAHWPLISPMCPVVNRLIAFRFPSLLKHILPFATPLEIVCREGKKWLSKKYECNPEDIKVFSVTACPAQMMAFNETLSGEISRIDGAIGINEIYDLIKSDIHEVQEPDEHIVLNYLSGVGIGWAMSGGEVAGLDVGRHLAVSGIKTTIRYLQSMEMGLLKDIDYVELRACREGCIGGAFSVTDKYAAKNSLNKLIRIFGSEKRVNFSYAKKLYREGWFDTTRKLVPLSSKSSHLSIHEGIKRAEDIETLLKTLPRKECGVCGCPDCRTFAEDVVDGMTSIDKCIFMRH